MSIDDFIALLSLIVLLVGVYLWVGLPPTLVLLGLIGIYIAARMQTRVRNDELDQTTNN
jgi:Flp pilus assembly protein TadB